MPIYEYRCADCGFQNEYLQKVSEPPMTVCPSCGKETFRKLLTAAGFQLKGSGWYVTDFRNSGKGASKGTATESPKGAAAESAKGGSGGGEGAGGGSSSESKSGSSGTSGDKGAASASAAG